MLRFGQRLRFRQNRGATNPVVVDAPPADEGGAAAAAYRLSQALRNDADNSRLWAEFGDQLWRCGRLEQAEAAFRRAIDEDPDGVADFHLRLGRLLHAQGRTEESEQACLNAMMRDPALLAPGEELQALGWSKERLASLRQSLPSDGPPRRAGPMKPSLGLQADRARDAGDWENAARLYRRVLDADPLNPAIWVQYGHALKECGRLADAENAYQRALSCAPGLADSHLQLGHVLKIQGKIEKARAAYVRSLILDPTREASAVELSRLGWPEAWLTELRLASSGAVPDAALDSAARGDSAEPKDKTGLGEYCLPDRLREYLDERFGTATVAFIREMMAVIDRYEEDQAGFAASSDFADLVHRIRLAAPQPNAEPVDVSIILPVFDGIVFTLTALLSLMQTPSRYTYEVLVGDDATTDETAAALAALGDRVRHIRHPENLGFVDNCNVTSRGARGRFLVFFNMDTLVLPGWLDELLDTFADHGDAAMVGSKLLSSDGTLQEAGAIFWRDVSGWNFGRGQDPRLPEFNYVKEADYCSGAAIAVTRPVWEQLGGFDPVFRPAYCEDADLAFRIRAAGKRVLYQPFSEIIHHEGKSMGRDTSTGLKSYQVVNKQKLFERWRRTFHDEHFPQGEAVFVARDRTQQRPHVLFVDHYIPTWDRDAGSRMTFQYLQLLVAKGCQVTFWPDNLAYTAEYAQPLQKIGIEIIHSASYKDGFTAWIKANAAWLNLVFLARPHIAVNYIDAVRAHTQATVAYIGGHLQSRHLVSKRKLDNDPGLAAETENMSALETALWEQSDVVYYPSEGECEIVRGAVPGKKATRLPVLFYGRETFSRTRERLSASTTWEPHHLLFVGNLAHRPNADGILWFAREVLPILRRDEPDFRLTIVGSEPTAEVRDLAGSYITVSGAISDAELERLYMSGCFAIAPLRSGGGVKGKVIEAFAHGVPLFATSIALQGIDNPQEVAFPADDAEGFIRSIRAAAIRREEVSHKLNRALAFVEQHHSVDAAVQALAQDLSIFQEL